MAMNLSLFRPDFLLGADSEENVFTPRNIPNLALWLDSSNGVKTGGAAQFTAANSEYLSIADNASLSTGDIDFSFAAWVYLDSKGAARDVVGKYTSSGNQREYRLYYDSTGDRFDFQVSSDGTAGNSAHAVASTFGSPSTGTWYFLVAQHDAINNLLSISVNAGTVDTAAHSGGGFDGSAVFEIGAREGATEPWDGRIARVSFHKRLLTAAEIAWLYNSGAGRTYEEFGNASNDGADLLTDLVSYWKLGEVSGSRADSHGSNTLTDNNTVTWAAGPSLIDAYEGSVVRQWNDRSGNGNNATPVAAANMPAFYTGVLNGKPCVRFVSASSQYLVANGVVSVGSGADKTWTVVAVNKLNTVVSNAAYFCWGISNQVDRSIQYIRMSPIPRYQYVRIDDSLGTASPSTTATPIVPDTSPPHILTARFNGTTLDFYEDATTEQLAANVSTLTPDRFSIGGRILTTADSFMQGDYEEFLVYDRALTNAEIKQLQRHLSSKYALGLVI